MYMYVREEWDWGGEKEAKGQKLWTVTSETVK